MGRQPNYEPFVVPVAAIPADKEIITLPLGVLKKKSVKFYPPLPQWKQTAINRLEMAVFNKLYLLFPKVFWDKDTHLLGHNICFS
jgi:monoamine oxidase